MLNKETYSFMSVYCKYRFQFEKALKIDFIGLKMKNI